MAIEQKSRDHLRQRDGDLGQPFTKQSEDASGQFVVFRPVHQDGQTLQVGHGHRVARRLGSILGCASLRNGATGGNKKEKINESCKYKRKRKRRVPSLVRTRMVVSPAEDVKYPPPVSSQKRWFCFCCSSSAQATYFSSWQAVYKSNSPLMYPV